MSTLSTEVSRYPVPNPRTALYEKYARMAAMEENVCFVGRLASYKYFNMDEVILSSLDLVDELKRDANYNQEQ